MNSIKFVSQLKLFACSSFNVGAGRTIAPDQIDLSLEGALLSDSLTLRECGIEAGGVVDVLLRINEPIPPASSSSSRQVHFQASVPITADGTTPKVTGGAKSRLPLVALYDEDSPTDHLTAFTPRDSLGAVTTGTPLVSGRRGGRQATPGISRLENSGAFLDVTDAATPFSIEPTPKPLRAPMATPFSSNPFGIEWTDDMSQIQTPGGALNGNNSIFSPEAGLYAQQSSVADTDSLWNKTNVSTGGNLNVTEQLYETRVRPEEERFYNLFLNIFAPQEDGSHTGCHVGDMINQATFARNYALVLQDVLNDNELECRREEATVALPYQKAALYRMQADARAERDLWALAGALTEAGLLEEDINENFQSIVEDVVNRCDPDASIAEVFTLALQSSYRVKKGRVLKDWVEGASRDKLEMLQSPHGANWVETLRKLQGENVNTTRMSGMKAKNSFSASKGPSMEHTPAVTSLHPDAQIGEDGLVLQLEGTDASDQETMLKSIWQLVRCGDLIGAQQLASSQDAYWLAASLLGVADPYSDPADPEEAHRGNYNRSKWMQTCAKYSSHLNNNKNNQMASSAMDFGAAPFAGAHKKYEIFGGPGCGIQTSNLEIGIYASLSNNITCLKNSPLLVSWADKIWSVLKSAHEADLNEISYVHHVRRSERSKLYPGASTQVMKAEYELGEAYRNSGLCTDVSHCQELFKYYPPPNCNEIRKAAKVTASGKILFTAEDIFNCLQSAFMGGLKYIHEFINETSIIITRSDLEFPGRARVVRVYCHLALWLRYSYYDTTGAPAALASCISQGVYCSLVGAYIDHLTLQKQRSFVAAYVACLPQREIRIRKYQELLLSMQSDLEKSQESLGSRTVILDISGTAFEEEREVIRQGGLYFNFQDLQEVCKRVVQRVMARNDALGDGSLSNSKATDIGDSDDVVFSQFRSSLKRPLVGTLAANATVLNNGKENDVSRADIRCIESLRWLLYRPDNRIEAVCQANNYVNACLVRMSKRDVSDLLVHAETKRGPHSTYLWGEIKKIQYLLDNVMPVKETLEICKYQAQEQRQKFQDRQNMLRLQMESMDEADGEGSNKFIPLNWSDSVWYHKYTVESSLLSCWQLFMDSMKCLEGWNAVMTEYNKTRLSLLGERGVQEMTLQRFGSKLAGCAEDLLYSLSKVMFTADLGPDLTGGLRLVWDKLKSAKKMELFSTIQSLRDECNAQEDGVVSADYVAEIVSLLEFLRGADKHEEHDDGNDLDDEKYRNYVFECILHLRGMNFLNETNEVAGSIDFADDVTNYIHKASEILEGLSMGNAVASSITNLVLSLYINVIKETATAMTRIGLQNEANEWYAKGVKVADVIASNDMATQFFSTLKKNHLKSIVGNINECLVNRLTISQRV